MATVIGTGWACGDCIHLFANGETPTEMSEDETATWLGEIDSRCAGSHVVLGGEHDGCVNVDDDGGWLGVGDCECETQSFSWSQCDTCGSRLGGSRHAVTYFAKEGN